MDKIKSQPQGVANFSLALLMKMLLIKKACKQEFDSSIISNFKNVINL